MSSSPKAGGDQGVVATVKHALKKYPMLVNIVSSGVIGLSGDLVCQFGIEGKSLKDYDVARGARLVAVNCMLVGPALTVWYGALGRATASWGTGLAGTAKRVLLDQIVFAPPFIGAFFSTAALLEGRPDDIPRRLREGWGAAVLANYQLWPLAQMINFGLVPPALRVVFSNCVGVLWNTYLSFATDKIRGDELKPPQPQAQGDEGADSKQ